MSAMAGGPFGSAVYKAHSEAGSTHNGGQLAVMFPGPAAVPSVLNYTQQPNGAAPRMGFVAGVGGGPQGFGQQGGMGMGAPGQQMQVQQPYSTMYATQGQAPSATLATTQPPPTGAVNYGFTQQTF